MFPGGYNTRSPAQPVTPSAADGATRGIANAGERVDAAVFRLFCLFIALVPFWFGSHGLVPWAINAAVAGLIVAALEANLLLSGRSHPVPAGRLAYEIVALLSIVALVGLQIAPGLPASLHQPIWGVAAEALGRPVPGFASINPDATALALLRLLTALAVFWLALQLCRDGNRAFRLVRTVALAGLAYALYGVAAETLFPDTILWFEEVHYRGYLTSTFVNRNTYATYAGIGLVASTAISLTCFRGASLSGPTRFRAARLVEAGAGPGGLFLVASFVIVVALFMSVSRAGITASLAGMLFLVLLSWSRVRRGRNVAIALGLVMLVLLGVGLTWFGGDYFGRLEQVTIAGNDRLAIYALAWRSILDAPLLGFGYGTFADVIPMYRDDSVGVGGKWEFAHNSYLEVLQGLGLLGGILLLLVLLALVVRCVLASARRNRDATAPLCAAAASVVVALHSFADFSLQIQAVALTWVALLGAGVSQSWSSRDKFGHDARFGRLRS